MSHPNQPICLPLAHLEMYELATTLEQKVEQLTAELNSARQQLECVMDRLKKTNDALEESQARLHTVISKAPIVVWALDRDGTLNLLDGKGLENSGLQPGQIIGQSVFDLYCNHPNILENIALVFAGRDGSWIAEIGDLVYESRATPMRDKMGQVVGIIGVSTDITQREHSEVALQKAKIELEFRVEERTAALKESNDQLVVEIVEHLQAEKALRYRVKFEQLIATISTHFINLMPEEIDSGMERALEAIATFSGVDRSYVFLLDRSGTQLNNTHEWCASGISPQIRHRQGISVEALHSWQQQIRRLETIYIPSAANLPRSQRITKAMLRSQSIQSLILVPMAYRGELIGFLGFDSVRVEKTWSEDIIALLRIVGEMFVNALERKRAKEALKESENNYRNLVETSQELIWSVDIEGHFTFVNSAAKRIYGCEPAEMIGRPFTDFLPSEEQAQYIETFEQQLAEASISGPTCPYSPYETVHLRRDGTPVYLSVSSIVYKGENGNVLGLTGTATDISDRKRSEAALQQAKDQLLAVLDAVPGLISWVSSDLQYIGVNQHLATSLKIPPENFINQEIGFLERSSGFAEFIRDFFASSAQQASQEIEIEINSSLHNYLIVAQKYHQGTAAVSVGIDISDRKRNEEEIKASLAEKEVLLKEIHHRVKNNLQVISSLLRLQSRYIHDRQVIEMLKESQNRVRSMALVHEQLYQSKDLSRINFAEYIHNLATNLFQAYEVNENGVSLEINIPTVYLNIDTAVHCGLIINELISNSLKYGFVRSKKGEVYIECLVANQQFKLSVKDNGIGFPADLDFRNSGSLGLRLVCSLVSQLRGSIELDNSSGTTFAITFSPPNLQYRS